MATKKNTKKPKEKYSLTFKGLVCLLLEDVDIEKVEGFIDKLELFLRRHGKNAIILEGSTFTFNNVEKAEKARNK